MEQYIKKSALVAEIERRKQDAMNNCGGFKSMREHECDSCIVEQYEEMKNIIDTLEVKEVEEEPVSNNYSALLPCIYNRTLEERVKYCKYCSAACEGRVKEPVSEDLEEAIEKSFVYHDSRGDDFRSDEQIEIAYRQGFETSAKWRKERLWKPADGENLPEIDREVIVFTQNFPNDAGIMKVAIAHRPDPNGWDGKSVTTGKVEHYTPKTYGKGGWNIPDVVMWLDLDIPKLEED